MSTYNPICLHYKILICYIALIKIFMSHNSLNIFC